MKLSIYTTIRSPHLLPLANELSKYLGNENFRYIYTIAHDYNRENMGWKNEDESFCVDINEGYKYVLNSEYLITSFRDKNIIEKRISDKKSTLYISERWFKPPIGILRLFSFKYRQMAKAFCKNFKSPYFSYLAIGIHAARDIIRAYELLVEHKLTRLFTCPKVAFESRPGGVILPIEEAKEQSLISEENFLFASKFGFCQIPKEKWDCAKTQGIYSKIKIWGYFVSPTEYQSLETIRNGILWVGRLIPLKKIETIIKACNKINISLDIYGEGPLKSKLETIANPCVHFHPFVSIRKIRELMHNHKIYVFPSNAYEGWGAVVSEALEEGMLVYASYESGAGATILPCDQLFPSKNYKALCKLLLQHKLPNSIGKWNAKYAANYLLNQIISKET